MGKPWWQMKLAGCLVEKASMPFLFDVLRACTGNQCQNHHWDISPSWTKQPLKKQTNPTTITFLLFADLRDKFRFPKKSLLVSILGGLGWSRYKMSNSGYPELHCHLRRVWHWAQVEQQKGEENQPSQEWSLLASSSRHAGRNEQFLSVVQSLSHVQLFVTPMDCSTSGFPILYYFPEFAPIHVHWDRDAIWPSCPLSPPSPAFNISQHQGLFWWVGSSPPGGQSTGVSAFRSELSWFLGGFQLCSRSSKQSAQQNLRENDTH